MSRSTANLFINVSTKENFENKLNDLFDQLDEAERRLTKINAGTKEELDTFKEFSDAINGDPNFGMNTISRFLDIELKITGINAKLERIEQYLTLLSDGLETIDENNQTRNF